MALFPKSEIPAVSMFSVFRRSSPSPKCRNLDLSSPIHWRRSKSQGDLKSEGDLNMEQLTLPRLERPLGVKERPTALIKTLKDKTDELMDQDKRLEHRKHLIKEAGKGYFNDLNNTRKFGGKTWIAPETAIREDKALYFPNIMGTLLNSKKKKAHTTTMCHGHISVIGVLSTKMSEEHIKNFVEPTNNLFISHPAFPKYQHILINLQENILKSMLVNFFLASVRRTVPEKLHSTYLVSSQNMEFVREPLGMVNKHIGYVYLVDEKCKIRWAGCGDAKVEESQALLRCTKVLLERLNKADGDKTNAQIPSP